MCRTTDVPLPLLCDYTGMRDDRSRLLERARRIDAVLHTLRRQAAERERERQTVPAEMREAIASFGHELGSMRGRIRRLPR
jgi:hypothetical protein